MHRAVPQNPNLPDEFGYSLADYPWLDEKDRFGCWRCDPCMSGEPLFYLESTDFVRTTIERFETSVRLFEDGEISRDAFQEAAHMLADRCECLIVIETHESQPESIRDSARRELKRLLGLKEEYFPDGHDIRFPR